MGVFVSSVRAIDVYLVRDCLYIDRSVGHATRLKPTHRRDGSRSRRERRTRAHSETTRRRNANRFATRRRVRRRDAMDAGDDAGEFATRRDAKANGRAATAGDGRGTRFRLWRDDGDDDGRARRWAGDLDSAGARSGGIWEGTAKATRDARRDGEGVARALDYDDDDGGWESAAASTTTSYESSTSRLRSARGDDDVAVFDEEAARDEAAEAEDDEARGALRGALDAVDLASRNAISRRFDVESVKELARECARARQAAGVRDLRFVDDADDELARESRLEEARAKCRAKVAEAEADFLRREAEEAKEKYISRYGDAGRAWVASLSARVDEWHADCAQKLTTVATSPRYADVDSSGAATLAATKWLHLLDASPTKRRRSLAARED